MKSHIVIHHSATKDGNTFDWGAIRQYHTSYRIDGRSVVKDEFERRKVIKDGKHFEVPWIDIGYHWGIESVNGHLEIIRGRNTDYDGAHCKQLDMNHKGIGICLIGNFDGEIPSISLVEKTRDMVQWLMGVYNIPWTQVVGHREVQAKCGMPENERKSCPGKLFNMDAFRSTLFS